MARELVAKFGKLAGLFSASESELCAVNGVGPAKYVQLQAVIEMGCRALEEVILKTDALNSPQAVRDYLRMTIPPENISTMTMTTFPS